MVLPNGANVSNSAGKLGRGLDIRTTGGYVVAPPSIHISGKAYSWLESPEDASLAPAPAWLIGKLKPNRRRSRLRFPILEQAIAPMQTRALLPSC
jgi:hypothetical protein